MTEPATTAPVTILGRTMTVTRPTETQITLMHRQGTITSKALARAIEEQDKADTLLDPKEREAAEAVASERFSKGLTAAAEILDVLEYLVGEDDREFLVEKMKRGELQIPDLFVVLEVFGNRKEKRAAKKAQRVA